MISVNENMKSEPLAVRKAVRGQVQYNDGEFAEVQTVGIEGIEENLLGEIIQIHRCDTHDVPFEFGRRFPVGSWLDILTTTEIIPTKIATRAN